MQPEAIPAPQAISNGAATAAPAKPTASTPMIPTPEPQVGGGSADTMVMPDGSALIDNGLWDGMPMPACCAICGGGSGCPPDWYVEEGARLLGRSRVRDIPLSFSVLGTLASHAFDPVMANRAASPDVSLAYATTFGHYFARDTLNRDHFVEFSFWGLNNWKDSATVNGQQRLQVNTSGTTFDTIGGLVTPFVDTATLFTDFVPDGFNGADTQSIYYSSYTNNFEINGRFSPRNREDRLVLHSNGKWRRECQPGEYISYLYGLRFLQLHETFRFHSESRVDHFISNTLVDSQTYTGDYDTVSHNNLLGLQFGADLTFRQCRWTWGVRAKAGPYINFSDTTSDISGGTPFAPEFVRHVSASRHEASFLGEVGFNATYKFRPNLMGRAGYDFMWVTGLALAPEQFQFADDPVNRINTNGLLFCHGVSLSLEWLW
jgi:hypothetical protein